MNAEQFHDALTLLPEDLVSQTDEFRSRKPKIIPWKQYTAVAACFAILLTSAVLVYTPQSAPVVSYSAAKQEAADAAPEMEAAAEAPMERNAMTDEAPLAGAAATEAPSCPMVETPCLRSAAEIDRSAAIITSRSELESYFTEMGEFYQLDALIDACVLYDAAWFSNSDLLLIPVDNVSPSCTVTDVSLTNGTCEITLTGEETEASTCFHGALPVDKGAVTDTNNISVIYNSDTNG
ncbi:MAG: hypothetical protein Q4F81_00105 [Eubacteriales bacterium]|nr:hypothetical protein [Eubacteriales bacterium]